MELIDLTTWDRALHYQIFRNSAQPQYCVSFELDITNFLTAAVADCANRIKEFRCRFVDGQPVVFDRIHTSFTYLNPDTELFKVVNVGMKDTLEEYVALAKRTEQNQKDYFTGPMGNDIFQFSAFPWVSDSGSRDNATPLFDWGRYFERDGRTLLPFSVQVHHSFVDGVHIGKLAKLLQDYLDCFCSTSV